MQTQNAPAKSPPSPVKPPAPTPAKGPTPDGNDEPPQTNAMLAPTQGVAIE